MAHYNIVLLTYLLTNDIVDVHFIKVDVYFKLYKYINYM